MLFKKLTKPPFLALVPGTWYLTKLEGAMQELPIPGKKPARVYPVSVFRSGAGPLPETHDVYGMLQTMSTSALVPANKSIVEAFDLPESVGAYFLLVFIRQTGTGQDKFNHWEIIRLELDQAEKDTLEGKEPE